MSSHKLREDNICQNCHYTVDRAYCSNCGQKNTETRQSFFHLIAHFAEDFTHYDGAFWKTIVHLLFRPAKLTKEYLSGKRQTYVPPVKLYIFISFVTFVLLIYTKPEMDDGEIHTKQDEEVKMDINFGSHRFTTVGELDKFLQSDKSSELNFAQYWVGKATVSYYKNNLDIDDVLTGYIHILPKVLFIYMPVFAFWLWLIHGKKRWYFFDHGIFTLHYFALLLLSIFIYVGISLGINLLPESASEIIDPLLFVIFSFYAFFYFFRAHSRLYSENRWISRLKSIVLFFINIIAITILLTASFIYVMNTWH